MRFFSFYPIFSCNSLLLYYNTYTVYTKGTIVYQNSAFSMYQETISMTLDVTIRKQTYHLDKIGVSSHWESKILFKILFRFKICELYKILFTVQICDLCAFHKISKISLSSLQVRCASSKGQLHWEWIYEVIVSPKMQTKYYKDFCPTKQTRIVAKKNSLNSPKNHQKKGATLLLCLVGQKSL